jgi:hypothetical protein
MNRLLLFRERVAVYCENHTEHINTQCGQNAEFWYIKYSGGTYSDHWALEGVLCSGERLRLSSFLQSNGVTYEADLYTWRAPPLAVLWIRLVSAPGVLCICLVYNNEEFLREGHNKRKDTSSFRSAGDICLTITTCGWYTKHIVLVVLTFLWFY